MAHDGPIAAACDRLRRNIQRQFRIFYGDMVRQQNEYVDTLRGKAKESEKKARQRRLRDALMQMTAIVQERSLAFNVEVMPTIAESAED